MIVVSSQDFRNVYQKLYQDVRRYLWPIDTLEKLSDIECNIYSAFPNVAKLKEDFASFKKDTTDVLQDDPYFSDNMNKMQKLIDSNDAGCYFRLPRVNEVNPEINKQIKTIPDNEEV